MISALILVASAQMVPLAANADSDPNKVTCRMEYELGSRIPRRACRTQAELDRMAREAQEDMRRSENQRHVVNN
ncbi:MAG: hypothetical protein M3Q52_10915 [Pseudomonadota bacterium]|nr:hypothetical protein [Pseudomonadota bacterium]